MVVQLCVINLAEAEVERNEIIPQKDNNIKLLVKQSKIHNGRLITQNLSGFQSFDNVRQRHLCMCNQIN